MTVRVAILLGLGVAATMVAVPAHAGLLGGGRHKPKKPDNSIVYAPTPYAAPPAPPADGAIFHAVNGYTALTSGARAAQVGDIITVILVEKTQAAKSNSASTDRSGNISVTPPPAGPIATALNKFPISLGAGGKFDGKGAAEQSNQLTGAISVTVAAVYPNGTMLVKGEKELTLNRGDEQIEISGLIRQADIDFDNTVPSTRVADAKITYTGKGEIARASTQGWLGRFFSRVSPF